jgi:putative addiction module component (TIGR02574 family)
MSQSFSESEIGQLTVPERLDLIALLWDSIPDSADGLPVPEWHRQELERRLKAAEANPEAGIPWEQVKSRLRGTA